MSRKKIDLHREFDVNFFSSDNYYEFTKTQFLQYFFNIGEKIEWVNEDEPADICVYSVVKKSKVHSVNPTNSSKR